jgi:hypothetical protein
MANLCFALAALCLLFSCRSGNHYDAQDPMPSLNMLLADSSSYSTNQIKEGNYTVIMYFRTDCIHCQMETADILKAGAALNGVNILLLTNKPLKDLKKFASFYKLADYPNIRAATDHHLEFLHYYKPAAVPFLVIFDRDKKLYRIYEGPPPIDSLKVLTHSL